MFEKVLIAEDHESSNISVRKALEDFGISDSDYAYYCDDALVRLSNAVKNNDPYDLLITDLSFEEDHIPQKVKNGTDLIREVKALQPRIKILVFSAEGKPILIDQLFKDLSIDAFVRKARRDVTELKMALEALSNNRKYLSTGLRQSIKDTNTYEFKEYDIMLIKLLSKGMLQKDIPVYLQQHDIKPFGLSSVEKRLNYIRDALNFTKNEQLVAFCKDIGVI
ncbi:MAG: response regulator [Bacteroidota bacterium]